MSIATSDRVQAILDQVRPFLQADGGDVQLVEVAGDSVHVRFTGACAGCPQAQMTLHFGLEAALRCEIPQVRVVEVA
jgi:Fe-S cluster biogenesis protein NfuA